MANGVKFYEQDWIRADLKRVRKSDARILRDNEIIAENLFHLRRIFGVNISELAEASGVSRMTIHKIEGERHVPSMLVIARLCEAFRVPMHAVIP